MFRRLAYLPALRSGYETAVCVTGRRRRQSWRGSKGYAHTVAKSLDLSPQSVIRYTTTFAVGWIDALFPARLRRVHDGEHQGPVFAPIHSPRSSYGINWTTRRMEDPHNVIAQTGHRMSEGRIRRIIKAAGYRWRKAKTVLTSNDPKYQSKLDAIKVILSELKPDEAFFSIDEYGPFAVKKKGGQETSRPRKELRRSAVPKIKRMDDPHSGSRAFPEPGDAFLFS